VRAASLPPMSHIATLAEASAEQRLVLAERAVPRYTSYPTAPHFSDAVRPATVEGWLGELTPETSLSLYLHIPYCREICLYCGCATKATRRQEPVDKYLDVLLREVVLVAERTAAQRVTHVHWGGGSPSILGEAGFARAVEALARAFDLSAPREHAIELDPRHVDRALARTLAAGGVNRVSFGAQDFAPHVQAAIGRAQSIDVVRASVERVRDAGISAVNLDLMYGLPLQTIADVERSAEIAVAMAPGRIALFGYAHVPWMRKHQTLIRTEDLPGPTERIAQEAAARAVLLSAGYVSIGLDHFARPDDPMAIAARAGTLKRNFQGYTTDRADALIGLGASSISGLPRGFAQNIIEVAPWARAIADGALPVARGVAFTHDDRVRGAAIERVMCDLAIDLNTVAREIDVQAVAAELAPLAAQGICAIEGTRVRVTESGRPFTRLVAACFDGRRSTAARHSVAV
jgi:oxygen-independent coproporphyrinogen III oxidase